MTRAVIRLRSTIKANHEVEETLRYLRLNSVNHCVLVPEGKSFDGMLQKVKDYVTWGEIRADVLTNLILKRGRLVGDRPITNQYIIENTKHESLLKMAEAIVDGRFKYTDLKGVKPVFRLHPPLKGLEGVKRAFNDTGSLGYRGEAINDLILRMLGPQKPVKQEEKKGVSGPTAAADKPKKSSIKAEGPSKKAPAKKKTASKEVSE